MPPRLRHDVGQRHRFGTLVQEMPCPACGALASFAPRARLAPCPSCGAPLVRGPDDHTPIAPTGVLRAKVDEAAVPALVAAALGTRRFAQARGATLTAFERIYVPMWRFTTHVVCSWVQEPTSSDSHGPDSKRSTGEFVDDYELQVAASTDVNGELLQLLEDVPLAGAEPFTTERLSGARVLPVNVPLQDAWVKARAHFDDQAMAGISAEGYSVWPHWSREEGALVLIPAYLGREETPSVSTPVLVDAVTGKVYGGIGNGPFRTPAGPLPTAVKVVAAGILLALAWSVLAWLDVSLLDLLGVLDAVLS